MKKILTKVFWITICLSFFGVSQIWAQNNPRTNLAGQRNVITTSVPFLSITPDSRSGALGDAGIALPPDANTPYWNPSKLAFVPNKSEISVSYTPWLSALVPDINLSYLSGYYRIDDLSAVSLSLRYFSLGDIQFTDRQGNDLREFRPNELALSSSYGRKLSDAFSVGLSLRYIHSNLTGGTPTQQGGSNPQPGNAVSGDISGYYNDEIDIFNTTADLSFGLNMRNVGSKITYTDEAQRDFIPMNLGLGTYLNIHLDQYNEIAIMADFNKLLVPTPPEFAVDSNGQRITKDNADNDNDPANFVISQGQNPNVSVIQGLTQSFSDAPGGFQEEMREIKPSIGVEYWYDDQFALRTGYFYEHENKGDRQYLTVGAGLRYNILGIDIAYLVPTNNQTGNTTSPLSNTLRLSLSLELDGGKESKNGS